MERADVHLDVLTIENMGYFGISGVWRTLDSGPILRARTAMTFAQTYLLQYYDLSILLFTIANIITIQDSLHASYVMDFPV